VTTYYDILNVEVSCSQEDIKRAFRKRAKELHPDVAAPGDGGLEKMRLLIQAYKTLSDPNLRQQYDRTHFIVADKYRFDYREFLRERKDDPHSQSKLIFFELLHDHPDEAVDLYDRLTTSTRFDLADHLDREDFMDCAFLLAEEYERRGELLRAYRLLSAIVRYEQERPYFRHFFEEVTDRLRSIVCFKMPGNVEADGILSCLEELIRHNFSRKDTAFFMKKAAEIYLDQNDVVTASDYLERGLELDQKLSGTKKLRDRIACLAPA